MIANAQTVLALLPAGTRYRLEELTRALAGSLGDGLRAVIVYGSAVRGGLTPMSDVDVLVVVDDDSVGALLGIKDALGVARTAARIDCRILKTDEIPRAADVFPVFYDDVRSCHAVLHGQDPFKDLAIHDEHRRLRVEQELRDIRIRLRRLITDAVDDDALRVGVTRKLKTARAALASLLRLHGGAERDELVHVLSLLGKRYGIDTTPLTSPSTASLATTTLAALLDAAITDVDTLGATGATP